MAIHTNPPINVLCHICRRQLSRKDTYIAWHVSHWMNAKPGKQDITDFVMVAHCHCIDVTDLSKYFIHKYGCQWHEWFYENIINFVENIIYWQEDSSFRQEDISAIERIYRTEYDNTYKRGVSTSKMIPSLRFKVLKRDDYRCQICGRTAQDNTTLEVDHKHPRALGGTHDLDNLWTLCFECNRGKSDSEL